MVRGTPEPSASVITDSAATDVRILTRPIGRRDLLTRAAALSLAAPVLGRMSAIPAAAQDAPAGTITFSLVGDPTLNPFTWPNQLPSILVAKNVFSTLLKYSFDDDSIAVGDLATEWSVSDDGLVWTFNLRDGVTWHDGEPFTAEDVKFTLDAIAAGEVRALFRGTLAGVTEVTVVDPLTVTIATEQPIGSLPTLLAYNIAITPKHILEGQDLNEIPDFVQNPIGTGPYMVREIISGDRVVLDANPDYFDGAPNIGSMIYKVVPDVNNIVAQLLTGELDMAIVEAANLDALSGSDTIAFNSALEPNTFAMYLNNLRYPFDDPQVRKAFTMAIDRQAIVDQLLLGEGVVATSSHSPAFGDFYNPNIEPYPYDVEAAAALMTEAGFTQEDGIWTKDGMPVQVELLVDKGNATREQMALFVQQLWQDFGADVTVTVDEWSVFLGRVVTVPGDYDASLGWRITAPDPDKNAEYGTDGANNHYSYSNPAVDELLASGRVESDHEARVAIYHELQQVLYDDCPIAWLYYPNGIVAYNTRIENMPPIGVRNALLYVYQMSFTS
ncbi:MAG: ABC transporter substrate-binding protein [Chloroflexota bacterium]|nr:ABC transporter substrate-binding protein [Chloroflexota bacterium]